MHPGTQDCSGCWPDAMTSSVAWLYGIKVAVSTGVSASQKEQLACLTRQGNTTYPSKSIRVSFAKASSTDRCPKAWKRVSAESIRWTPATVFKAADPSNCIYSVEQFRGLYLGFIQPEE